jgi:site-specific recombinase XerD
MVAARKSSRYGHRDATMILIAYRHGLRASEVCDLQWHQVELATGRLHVRPKQERDAERSSNAGRRDPRTAPLAARTRAGLPFPIHPHMLPHACGYALANAGHDTRALQAWLDHRNIQHTVRYTELAPVQCCSDCIIAMRGYDFRE